MCWPAIDKYPVCHHHIGEVYLVACEDAVFDENKSFLLCGLTQDGPDDLRLAPPSVVVGYDAYRLACNDRTCVYRAKGPKWVCCHCGAFNEDTLRCDDCTAKVCRACPSWPEFEARLREEARERERRDDETRRIVRNAFCRKRPNRGR